MDQVDEVEKVLKGEFRSGVKTNSSSPTYGPHYSVDRKGKFYESFWNKWNIGILTSLLSPWNVIDSFSFQTWGTIWSNTFKNVYLKYKNSYLQSFQQNFFL